MRIEENAKGKINDIFQLAASEGRAMLYEHEIYEMLGIIGIDVPVNIFIQSSEVLTEKMLSQYGSKIVVKIVSKDIAHKQKVGGVKIINNYDMMFVKYIMDAMKKEVMNHFEPDNAPDISGFLLVECVDFSNSLGNEILVGVKQDDAFGPIITLSKGGDDAEFFAQYYDPANLFLPHVPFEDALTFVENLNISKKYNEIGHPEYSEYIAKAASLISDLAQTFSKKECADYYLESLDINPFVFTKDSKFMAIDGYATFNIKENSNEILAGVSKNNLEGFFKPKGIAVIGVSADVNKYSMGREIAKLLFDLGRKDIYCVNIKGGKTKFSGETYPLYKSYNEIHESVDLVVYAAPARYISDFFSSVSKAKLPKSVILIPGIPPEMKYDYFKEQLKEIIPKGVRVVGPNCMGVFQGPHKGHQGVNTLFIEKERLEIATSKFSNTALLTQSGGVAITLLDKMKVAPIFQSIVSFGNKLDVRITDLMLYFEQQEDIEVIALYVEGFSPLEGRDFYELAQKSIKPVIVYKSGKTAEGAKAAASHTASMTGDYDVFKAACEQSGAILIDDIKSYYDCIKTFSLLSKKKVNNCRVAGITNAGFEATVAADELGILKLADFSDETAQKLEEINQHGLVDLSNAILDVTPMTNDVMFGEFVEAILKDKGVDAVFISIVPHVDNIKATPATCRDEDSIANILIRLFKQYDKPMVVSVNAGNYYEDFVQMMAVEGIPVYNDIRSSVKSLEIFMKKRCKNINRKL